MKRWCGNVYSTSESNYQMFNKIEAENSFGSHVGGQEYALQHGKKSGKKAKYAVFCGSDQAAGKCFERGRFMTVLTLFHFHEFCDLILLKTENASLEISSDFKHCPSFEVDSIVNLGHFVNSHCFQHLTSVMHWVSFQEILKNYQRNLPETFDACLQMPSNSITGLVL